MLDFFWVRLMGKTAGDTSVAGKLKDASEFARRAIAQGVAFVPGVPLYAADADAATLRLSFATADVWRFWRGLGGWGGRCEPYRCKSSPPSRHEQIT